MKTYVREGKSKDEIIQSFMSEMNIANEESLKYDIITAGSKGLMGFFAKPAILKFYYESLDERLKTFLNGFFEQIEVKFESIDINKDERYIYLDIHSVDNPGFVIGKEARFLDSLQHISNRVLDVFPDEKRQVILDVDGYRKRKEEAIKNKVQNIAEKVVKRNKSITMDPMPARERRVVHQYVESDKRLRTLTIGNGELKRVVIFPAKGGDDRKDRRGGRKNYGKKSNPST